jgi:hypothetical protein
MSVQKFSISLVVFCCVLVQWSVAQEIRQTVRGKIIDEDSRAPLPGANVRLAESAELLGASTDVDGTFRIPNVPVGRITLLITFVGYEDRILPNILVTSGKETVLEISLKESLILMDAIVVDGNGDKSEISNEMALTSARAFTVEETKRYAGSWNDPARMVSAYAGVDSDAAGDNSIIVRGNSPKGIQWRLEGIDIPNPNHFSDEGATGGPINALNSSMLTNADFYTGAFAPEFGNALSGVFDMRLRKGNNEKREHSISIGVLGTDATIEGPFSKNSDASYLINYRYSTLSLLNSIGLVDFGGIPKYQDMSFKFHLPTRSLGTFSVFGVGGKSNIREEFFDEDNEDILLEQGNYKSHMGVVGVTQYLPLGSNTFLQNSLSVSQNGSGYLGYEPDDLAELQMVDDFALRKKAFKGASTLTHKFNARHTIQTGLVFTRNSFDFYNLYLEKETGEFVNDLNQEGKADQYQGFVTWKVRPWPALSIVSGAHVQAISINNSVSLEPRLSMRWQFAPLQALTAGFGIHGKMETLTNYYAILPDENGNPCTPNRDLGFTKARHYIVGYENKLSQNLFLKAEAYYQQLYDVPVEDDPSSSYSLINQVDGLTDRRLVNRGTGSNLGVELTLERYFADDYYFLITSSVFDSRYTALDGVERNTLFNGQLIGNVLVGKEFHLNSRSSRKKVLGVNAKLTSLGGRRYTPINLEESITKQRTVFHEDRAFSERGDNIFIINLAISYRIDNRKINQELKLDLQNLTNNAAKLGYYYNDITGKVESFTQLPLLPVLFYTISF